MGERPDLAARLAETAARVPDRPALLWEGQEISYRELDGRADAVARGLQGFGVAPGDRVGILLGNTPAFVATFLGALRAGATAVPLHTGVTSREAEHVLVDSGARVLVAGEAAEELVLAVRDRTPALEHVVLVDREGPDVVAWSAFTSTREAAAVDRDPDDVAALVYTSGTTGRPRGAILTRRNLAANQDQALATPLAIEEGDVVLLALPLFHIYALNVGLGLAVRVGATLLLVERFDPVAALDDVERHRVSVILGAPPMYVAWLETPGVAERDLSHVRAAVSGAAALPGAVLERCERELGLTVWEGYGLTEASPAVASSAVGGAVKPGAVGRPLPGVELRVVDGGADVPQGDPGEVWVRGENVFRGYWNDPEATAEVLTADGWLRTGDIGILDADGDLHLVDRTDDLVIVSGFNVYPREIEEVLHEHPDVAAAAVVGVSHPCSGEAVKAFVVPRVGTEITAEDALRWCDGRLARFKQPTVVEVVEALPTTPTGKVRRGALRGGTA
ncbi:MAG: long-chain-fatty-acid--CoA ligase [Nitriliruptorales bacterium]